MASSQIEYSVIIPVFNEEGSLAELQERLYRVMEGLGGAYEIIYIDDGSTDSSPQILKKLKSACDKIKIISFNKNAGKGPAMQAAFKEASGRWMVTLDADLQNPPEEIQKLAHFKGGADYIIGIRKDRKDNFIKISAASIARFFRRVILGDVTRDAGCGLRIFRKEAADGLPKIRNFFVYMPFLARQGGYSVVEIPILHDARKHGCSKYGIINRAWRGLFDIWKAKDAGKRLRASRELSRIP